jgi:hypothetical protein
MLKHVSKAMAACTQPSSGMAEVELAARPTKKQAAESNT